MYDLANFKMSEMIECGSALRQIGAGAGSMEEVANRIVRHLGSQFRNPADGGAECSLVRFYKTHLFGDLTKELQEYALKRLEKVAVPDSMKCLTLLATVGEKPEWNARRNSVGHRTIPLPSENVIELFPMISRLIRQFGVEASSLITPPPTALMMEIDQKTYNVFHVEEALGSLYVPAQQDFVVPCRIQSVLGFGGMLPDGNLFAIIIFSKVRIPKMTADMFKTLALNVKMAILPFVNGKIFSEIER